MGIPESGAGVQIIKLPSPFKGQLLPIVDGLSASAHTASRAGHDLHEVVMDLSPVDPLQKSPGVSQAADCCRPEHQIVDLEFCLLDAVVGVEAQAAHCPEGVCRSIFPF